MSVAATPADDTTSLPPADESCCICAHEHNLVSTKCGHRMHLACMLQWSQRQTHRSQATTCPLCREVLVPVLAPAVPLVSITRRLIRTGHQSDTAASATAEQGGTAGSNRSRGSRGTGAGTGDARTGSDGDRAISPHSAAVSGSIVEEIDDMVSMLLRNVQSVTPHDELLDRVNSGEAEAVAALLADHPDALDMRKEDGTTALHHAIYRGHTQVVQALLAAGANPRLSDRFGITPLHASVTVGSLACAKALLDKGACVEAADRCGETALFYAVRAKDAAMVCRLLRRGCDVNAENVMGNTVYHLLAHDGFPHNLMHMLVTARPRCLDAANYIGDTPVHIAVENNNVRFLHKLKNHVPFHTLFASNHVGFSAEDYVEPDERRYDAMRMLLDEWQREQEEEEEDDEDDDDDDDDDDDIEIVFTSLVGSDEHNSSSTAEQQHSNSTTAAQRQHDSDLTAAQQHVDGGIRQG